VSNGSSPTSDWEQGYGFQFWRCRHGFYRGDGAHGQFCIVLPQYDAVVAITSGTRDMASVMNLVWDVIESLDAKGEAVFSVRIGGADQRIVAAPGAWRKSVVTSSGGSDPIGASGGWTSDDTYTLRIVRYRTPFVTTYRLRFAGDQLTVESEQNVGAADRRVAQWVGRAQR
jgi:hypothetical protein